MCQVRATKCKVTNAKKAHLNNETNETTNQKDRRTDGRMDERTKHPKEQSKINRVNEIKSKYHKL